MTKAEAASIEAMTRLTQVVDTLVEALAGYGYSNLQELRTDLAIVEVQLGQLRNIHRENRA